jgi:hypothetical protein
MGQLIPTIGDRKTCADCQCGELIGGIAANPSISKLFLVKALEDVRMPFAGYWPDHRSRIDLTTINANCAAEASFDVELDSMIVLRAKRGTTDSKYMTLPGAGCGGSFLSLYIGQRPSARWTTM